MNVLVLGASGMLGHVVFRVLAETTGWQVYGSVRTAATRELFHGRLAERTVVSGDLQELQALSRLIEGVAPDVVINCLSLPRDEMREGNAQKVFLNLALLPRRMAHACAARGARLVHISSDAVFAGARGGYREDDSPDAEDVYGIAKILGEAEGAHAISLRTSMIGHELRGSAGLLEWFLSQQGACRCYARAILSGLPTPELARIIRDVVLPRPDLSGVYHVASRPIAKCELLRLIADEYGKSIQLIPDDGVVIDRSLNADRFRAATGYQAPEWPELIRAMHADHLQHEGQGAHTSIRQGSH